MIKISATTPIAALGLLHLSVVKDEIFLVGPAQMGSADGRELVVVNDLAVVAALPVEKVIQKLQWIVRESLDIEWTREQAQSASRAFGPGVILNLDLDGEMPGGIDSSQCIHFFAVPFHTIKDQLSQAPWVLTCSSKQEKSYSAAMQLRFLGFANVHCWKF